MSAGGDILRQIALSVAKEAVQWAIDKVKSKAKAAALTVDDDVIRALVETEMVALYVAARSLQSSLDADMAKLDEAEREFRASPNVEVVDSIGEP